MNGANAFTACAALMRRDVTLAFRYRGETAIPLLFFAVVASLFPLALNPDPQLLSQLAPGVVWVSAALAFVVSLDAVFRSDYEDGTLEQMVLSRHPLAPLVLARVAAHWLVTGLPLVLAAPVIALWYRFPVAALDSLLLSLLIGTPVLSLIGTVGVALTVGLGSRNLLMPLLVLPLWVPVLIFGAGAAANAAAGLPARPPLMLLGALLALATTLTPFATAAALRISVEQ